MFKTVVYLGFIGMIDKAEVFVKKFTSSEGDLVFGRSCFVPRSHQLTYTGKIYPRKDV